MLSFFHFIQLFVDMIYFSYLFFYGMLFYFFVASNNFRIVTVYLLIGTWSLLVNLLINSTVKIFHYRRYNLFTSNSIVIIVNSTIFYSYYSNVNARRD
jgi:hypothetical protein